MCFGNQDVNNMCDCGGFGTFGAAPNPNTNTDGSVCNEFYNDGTPCGGDNQQVATQLAPFDLTAWVQTNKGIVIGIAAVAAFFLFKK